MNILTLRSCLADAEEALGEIRARDRAADASCERLEAKLADDAGSYTLQEILAEIGKALDARTLWEMDHELDEAALFNDRQSAMQLRRGRAR